MSTGKVASPTIVGRGVGPIGFGMLGLTNPWTPVDQHIAVQTLKTALKQGANLWNGVSALSG